MSDVSNTKYNDGVLVSVIMKTFNEEERIAAAIESVITEVNNISSEIIIADSYSTDQTVNIAANYPVKIVQLANASERCCGIGPELGFRHALGKYVVIMDGDMQMEPGFINKAIKFLEQHKDVAGVAGLVREMELENMTFKSRSQHIPKHMTQGIVDRLNMGGMYRKEAINDVEYFSNRNLHAFEEFELGLRLGQKKWKLVRLPVNWVKHFGHSDNTLSLLWKRWKSKYSFGPGELVHAALFQPYLKKVILEFKAFFMIIFWWISLIVGVLTIPVTKLPIFVSLALGFVLFFLAIAKKRSVSFGAYAFLTWNILSLGLLAGLIRKQISPLSNIKDKCVKDSSYSYSEEEQKVLI